MSHTSNVRTKNLYPNGYSFQATGKPRRGTLFAAAFKSLLLFLPAILFFSTVFAQTFPPASSCTSKDLTLTGATLPGTDLCNTCIAGDSVYRTLRLTIFNKTGSTRTAFSFWGTLEIRNSDGSFSSSTSITGCGGPVAKNTTTPLSFSQIGYVCGQSLTIKDLFLAWTDASPNSTCASINSATINPKCGTLDSIRINTGLDASFSVTNFTCAATPGSIDMTPLGGKSPYTYAWVASNGGVIPSGQSTSQDLTGLVAGTYTVTITDDLNCTATRFTTVTASPPVTADAGTGFTKTCTQNSSGLQIGEASQTGFTYSWSPTAGLDNASISNPTANPGTTTTYTVTKTNTASGCFNTDAVTVTVNNAAVTANAGDDFTKTCTSNASGKQIGVVSEAGFTYSWSPAAGLDNANISNPTANPGTTTTYIVTKTNTSSGCFNTDAVTVTVNNAAVTADAGDNFTKTCTTNASGKQIGVASEAGFTYSWSPATGLSDASISNPTANPGTTTTYTVTRTNTSSGCFNTDAVNVTVNNAAVTANAGDDFTKTCTSNASGKQIGVASEAGFTYSWSPTAGLDDASISNPTANPGSTTTYTVTRTNTSSGCFNTDAVTVTVNNAAVTANAGDDFTKTCTSNASGKQIGVASEAGFSYSWSPATDLSDASISNPTANPGTTTTYTVTRTNTSSGCFNTDEVTVTVNNAAVTANAGDDFTKTCTSNASGKQIGVASEAGFSYSWSPTTDLSDASISNPTANPGTTTTYTVTKTNTSSGCSNTDMVTVTVDTETPDAPGICVVQPSLCGPTTGSVTILSPLGADYQYSINNGGDWQSGTVFPNLGPGSVTGIKVKKLSSGCISTTVNCDASDCSSQTGARSQTTSSTQNKSQTLINSSKDLKVPGGQTTVKAFPNPFGNKVKFVVTVPEAGNGSLELLNLMGQKVKTVFQGRIAAGANTFEVNLPLMQSSQLIYILRMGDKQVTGKLLQLNQ